MSFSEQEIEEFKVEALELLDMAEQSLLSLNQKAPFEPVFDTVFRCFHSLKGGAGMMDLGTLQAHVHELESILMRFKGAQEMPNRYVSFFLKGIDGSRTILDGKKIEFDYSVTAEQAPVAAATAASPAAGDLELLSGGVTDEFVAECEEIVERVASALQAIERKEFSKDLIDGLYRDIHTLKGSAYLFSFKSLGDVARYGDMP